jgi:hypothetical protein
MRRRRREIRVEENASGLPKRLWLGPDSYCVRRVIDAWRYGGEWWRGEPPRDYYHIETTGGAGFIVYREGGTDRWVLALELD